MARESAFDPIASTRTLWKTQMQAPATRPSAADKKTRSTRLRPSSRTSASRTMGVSSLVLRKLLDRKSTRLNSSHGYISYAVFCLKKKKKQHRSDTNQKDN